MSKLTASLLIFIVLILGWISRVYLRRRRDRLFGPPIRPRRRVIEPPTDPWTKEYYKNKGVDVDKIFDDQLHDAINQSNQQRRR